MPPAMVAAFEPEQRLIYVARLLETLALMYGVSLDWHGPGLNLMGGASPAGACSGRFTTSRGGTRAYGGARSPEAGAA